MALLCVVAGLSAWVVVQAQGAPGAGVSSGGAAVWILAALFMGLLLASGLIAASETALFALDKIDISRMRNSTLWIDRWVVRLRDRANETLVTILLANNIINICASMTSGALMLQLFGADDSAWTFVFAAALATTGILLFGEIWPKLWAFSSPHFLARMVAPILLVISVLLAPARWLLDRSLRGVYGLLNIPAHHDDHEVTDEEIKVMINTAEVSQVLKEEEIEMIDGVFQLRSATAADVLTPRVAVVGVPDTLDQEEMIARLRQHPNSRVLVYHETLDHLTGFLLAKEVLLDAKGDWRTYVREALCVPERIGLFDLLQTLRRQRRKMAVVVDEYGGVAGIVTLQDLLEEIVGDIYEHHEPVDRDVQSIDVETWRVAGKISLGVLGDELEVTFPENHGRTVGGFVMNTLGRIPRVGDEITFGPLTMRVEEMAGRRVPVLAVTRAGAGPDAGGNGGAPGENGGGA